MSGEYYLCTDQQTQIKERIDAISETGHSLEVDYWVQEQLPCPFLENGNCQIYEVRPLLCRQQNSRDRNSCINGFNNRSQDEVESWAAPKEFYSAIIGGTTVALRDTGLAFHNVELTSGMKILLETPDTQAQWFEGQDSFQEAITPDNSSADFVDMFARFLGV